MPHLAGALLGGAILSLLPFGSAQAGTEVGMGHESVIRLSVTTDSAEVVDGRAVSSSRTVVLTCDPPSGPHPRAVEACAQLETSRGRVALEPTDGICTMEFSPRTVEAEGQWNGEIIKFSNSYGNACEMSVATGVLFDF